MFNKIPLPPPSLKLNLKPSITLYEKLMEEVFTLLQYISHFFRKFVLLIHMICLLECELKK